MYAIFASETGQTATRVKADPYPDVQWVTSVDGSRNPGVMEDRAATFLPELNLIQINADFRVFTDMIARFSKMYGDVAGASSTIKEVVCEWFEQSLVEAVLGVQSLEGAREWSDADISKALSEEALTAAVMPRYHIDFSIKRALGTRLGSLKTK